MTVGRASAPAWTWGVTRYVSFGSEADPKVRARNHARREVVLCDFADEYENDDEVD